VRRGLSTAVLLLLAAPGGAAEEDEAGGAVAAARAFLDALTEAQRAAAALSFDHPARRGAPGAAAGVVLDGLDDAQRERADALLGAALGAAALDLLSGAREPRASEGEDRCPPGRPRPPGPPTFVAIFGAPDVEAPWALRYDGRLASVHVAFDGDTRLGITPFHVAADVVPHGADERDPSSRRWEWKHAGLALVTSLTPRQLELARPASRPPSRAFRGWGAPLDPPVGLALSRATEAQRALALALLDAHAAAWPEAWADEARASLRDAPGEVRFLWLGGVQVFQRATHVLRGPTFWIEVHEQAGGVHVWYRDPRGDFGGGAR
jgi:hypothetical protein